VYYNIFFEVTSSSYVISRYKVSVRIGQDICQKKEEVWIDLWVGGVSPIQTFFGFLEFFLFLQDP